MPSRPIIIAIIAFWLATTGWIFYRETYPRLGAEEAPSPFFDAGDEVGRHIRWKIIQKGQSIGILDTFTKLKTNHTFELRAEYRFYKQIQLAKGIDIKNIFMVDQVSPNGDLHSMATEVKFHHPLGQLDVKLNGKVEDNSLHSEFKLLGWFWKTETTFKMEPVALPANARTVNTMRPMHRIPNLHEGMRWRIPSFNPIKAAVSNVGLAGVATSVKMPELIADVHSAQLKWDGAQQSCWRIDYAEPGKKTVANTWVRKRDGLVLQQQAVYEGMELVLRRTKLK